MYWLLYDISDTGKRNKMVRLCKDYGLSRIQKSCFAGEMLSIKVELFKEKVKGLVSEGDSVVMFPMTDNMMEKMIEWGESKVSRQIKKEGVYFI